MRQEDALQIRNGFPMTTQLSVDTDWQVRRIASMSSSRVDELAEDVVSSVRAEVEFYKSARVVTDDDLYWKPRRSFCSPHAPTRCGCSIRRRSKA